MGRFLTVEYQQVRKLGLSKVNNEKKKKNIQYPDFHKKYIDLEIITTSSDRTGRQRRGVAMRVQIGWNFFRGRGLGIKGVEKWS